MKFEAGNTELFIFLEESQDRPPASNTITMVPEITQFSVTKIPKIDTHFNSFSIKDCAGHKVFKGEILT